MPPPPQLIGVCYNQPAPYPNFGQLRSQAIGHRKVLKGYGKRGRPVSAKNAKQRRKRRKPGERQEQEGPALAGIEEEAEGEGVEMGSEGEGVGREEDDPPGLYQQDDDLEMEMDWMNEPPATELEIELETARERRLRDSLDSLGGQEARWENDGFELGGIRSPQHDFPVLLDPTFDRPVYPTTGENVHSRSSLPPDRPSSRVSHTAQHEHPPSPGRTTSPRSTINVAEHDPDASLRCPRLSQFLLLGDGQDDESAGAGELIQDADAAEDRSIPSVQMEEEGGSAAPNVFDWLRKRLLDSRFE